MIVSICQASVLEGMKKQVWEPPRFIPGCVISRNCWKGCIGHGMSDRMCWESSPIGLWHLGWSWSSQNTTGLDLLTGWGFGWPSKGEGPTERVSRMEVWGTEKGWAYDWLIDELCHSWGTYDCVIFPRSCTSMEKAAWSQSSPWLMSVNPER